MDLSFSVIIGVDIILRFKQRTANIESQVLDTLIFVIFVVVIVIVVV